MHTEITLLSDDTLDVVAGGVQNSGVGHLFQKPPITGGGGDSLLGLVEGIVGVAVAATKDGLLLGPLGSFL